MRTQQVTRKTKHYYKANEVAEMLMVSPVTVRKWASQGLLKAATTLGGHRRFLHADVEEFARDNDLTLNIESGDTLKVLIVDDDVQLATYFVELLQGLPMAIETEVAHDGFSAGGLVQSFAPNIVLLDVMMPDLDGVTVCQRIKEHPVSRRCRVIAMTGYFTEERAADIVAAGAETLLSKPIDKAELLAAMRIESQSTANSTA